MIFVMFICKWTIPFKTVIWINTSCKDIQQRNVCFVILFLSMQEHSKLTTSFQTLNSLVANSTKKIFRKNINFLMFKRKLIHVISKNVFFHISRCRRMMRRNKFFVPLCVPFIIVRTSCSIIIDLFPMLNDIFRQRPCFFLTLTTWFW